MTITLKELAKLIKICNTEGVSSLKFEGIELSLGVAENSFKTPAPQARGSAKKALEVQVKQEQQSFINLAQEMEETLLIEDPSAYERMLINGELKDEGKEN